MSTACVRFTRRFLRGAVIKAVPPIEAPILEVLAYRQDRWGRQALVVGRGKCPLWFPLDKIFISREPLP